MEESSRTDFIPITEHGLPLNPEDATSQVNLATFDQPVYRSICVEPIQELAEPMQRVMIMEPVALVRDDLALEKVRYSKSRSNSIDSVGNGSKPLRLEDSLVLERTKFTVAGDYPSVRARVVDCLQSQNVMFQDANNSPTLHCSYYQDGHHITFDVNIYRADTSFVIEFQRRSGCSMVFCKLFRKATSWINTGKAPEVEPISPQQLAAMLQSSQLTASSRLMGLQILRRWLREDPEEAAAAFANLVSSGFLTGPDVVELATEIIDISLLPALCSLSKLASSDTTSVAKHWSLIKRRLITAFSSGDAHLVSEACELCFRMQAHARSTVELSSRCFVDNDVISAARARLDRDSQSAPFCLAVAVRSMIQATYQDV